MKTITLCADDYGQNATVSAGILELIQLGRLSAVSCMTGYAHWPEYGAQLAAIKNQIAARVDIGLHFDLSDFITAQGWSFNQLIINSCLGKVDLQLIEAEFIRQLDAFEAVLGMAPEFVDGHQHIHVFPGIRQVFIRVLKQRYPMQQPYIRLSAPEIAGHDASIKAVILRALVIGFAGLAKRNGFQFPTQFLGMYSLRPVNYAELFNGWLAQAKNHSLFMCHPGLASNDPQDPIKKARLVEFEYLRSDAFTADLRSQQAVLGKWHAAKR